MCAHYKTKSRKLKDALKADRHGATLPRNLGVQRLPCNLRNPHCIGCVAGLHAIVVRQSCPMSVRLKDSKSCQHLDALIGRGAPPPTDEVRNKHQHHQRGEGTAHCDGHQVGGSVVGAGDGVVEGNHVGHGIEGLELEAKTSCCSGVSLVGRGNRGVEGGGVNAGATCEGVVQQHWCVGEAGEGAAHGEGLASILGSREGGLVQRKAQGHIHQLVRFIIGVEHEVEARASAIAKVHREGLVSGVADSTGTSGGGVSTGPWHSNLYSLALFFIISVGN